MQMVLRLSSNSFHHHVTTPIRAVAFGCYPKMTISDDLLKQRPSIGVTIVTAKLDRQPSSYHAINYQRLSNKYVAT